MALALSLAACGDDGPMIGAATVGAVGSHSLTDVAGEVEPLRLTPDRPSAAVEFALPAGAAQGRDAWYGVRLAYEWTGRPARQRPAYLYAKWNGQAVYQLKITPTTARQGFDWSMVDIVNGASSGHEIGATFRASSTNFATFDAIRGGRNELLFELDAPEGDTGLTVAILPRTSIIVTRWEPPRLDVTGQVSMTDDDELAVHLSLKNHGWTSPSLRVAYLRHLADGTRSSEVTTFASGIRGGEDLTVDHKIRIDPHAVLAVDALVDWGTGTATERLWPPPVERSGNWFRGPWYWLGVGAVAVLWVSLSRAPSR